MTTTDDFLAELLGEPEKWQNRALCAQVDHEMFFPEKGGRTKDAKRICGMCPVREECLEYALENEEKQGIWGGTSPRERARILRERRRWEPGPIRAEMRTDPPHNRSRYQKGCRCAECVEAERFYQHERHLRRRAS